MLPNDYNEMIVAMLQCEQTKGQSVYQHGQSVWYGIEQLLEFLNEQNSLDGWRIPDWLVDFRSQIKENLWDKDTICLYALNHDCGKPYCKYVDEMGKSHFPDHALVSKTVWEHIGGCPIVGHLIGEDMVIHTASAELIEDKLKNQWTIKDAMTLLLTALVEVHSNSKMFGGLESPGFKAKYKKIVQRGKQICKFYF